MKRRLILLCAALGLLLTSAAFAQQQATLSGIVKTEGDVAEGARVAVHIVDRDNVWQREVASAVPVGGTFSVTTQAVEAGELVPFRSGSMLFPGLQNEYSVEPADVNYARALVNVYVDQNGNSVFDNITVDGNYIGVASLEAPIGFFSLIYVDKAATVTGKGAVLELVPGWNVFTVRFPEGEDPSYSVAPLVDDIVMDVFLP